MYYEIKDQCFSELINLDKVDKVSLNHRDHQISITIAGRSEIIPCKDEVEANQLYDEITKILIKEKGVVSR